MIEGRFWSGKRVLVTGHTGFKGSWLFYWLHLCGAVVTGYARAPSTQPSLFDLLQLSESMDSHYGELSDGARLLQLMQATQPEFVFHLAAQAQVVPGYAYPAETFATNVMGTVSLLEAVRQCRSVRVCQVVTSDKCYAQPGSGLAFVETDDLGGGDPYSASKAAAELVTASYRDSFFFGDGHCSIATVRAGNALGGGDWSGQRLFPNAVRALLAGNPIVLTHPDAVRPWQYVLEPLSGYLWLAQRQYAQPRLFGEAWNFGPEDASAVPVRALVARIISCWGQGSAEVLGTPHQAMEEPTLKISIAKARERLAWRPAFDLDRTVQETVRSYRGLYAAVGQADEARLARAVCANAIETYSAAAHAQNSAWAVA